MKKSRRKNKQKRRNKTSRGGALKHALISSLAALSETKFLPHILPGENKRRKSIFNLQNRLKSSSPQQYTAPKSLAPYVGEHGSEIISPSQQSYISMNKAPFFPVNSENKWKFKPVNFEYKSSELSPMANAKDINGNTVSQEEAANRIAEWHRDLEEAQKNPNVNPDNICSIQDASSMCSGSIGIPRSLMPQIKRVNRQAFFDFLKDWTGNENLVHDETLDITSLIPTQSELMQPLIQKQINRRSKNGTTPPTVIVTRDPTTGVYTLYDGHHRWAAMYQQLPSGQGGTIETTVIDLPIMYTLELSAAFGAPHAVTDV
jgi:hypothetical protein